MLHVLSHDSHSGQPLLGTHGVHGTVLYFLGKLSVEHAASLLGILIPHTDARAVLRRGLAHQEHAYTVIGQAGEDAAVDAYHTHHGQARHSDERGALDAGDALDDAGIGLHLVLDDGAGCLGIECVLDENGDMLDAHGIDGGRIDHLGTEVAEFHGLYIAEFGDDVGRTDDARIGCHESIHVGPYLQHSGIQHSCYDAGCVVAAAASQVGHLAALGIGTDKAAHQTHLGDGLPVVLDKPVGELRGQTVLAALDLGLDKRAAVIPLGVLDQRGNYTAADALAIGDDSGQGLGAKVMDEIDTLVDAAQLLQ